MTRTPITPRLSVAGQPSPDEIAALPAQGVSLLINNRPDGEEPGQPGTAAEAAAARAAGLDYLHLPVAGPAITGEDVARFRAAVDEAPGAVVAHCRSGTRSLTLWVLGEVLAGNLRREDVMPYGRERGFDLSGALRWLDAHSPNASLPTAS